MATINLTTSGSEQTQILGRRMGELAEPGDVFLLSGPLGAGKTCFTQGLVWGLGSKEHARSPTFVLITRYQGRLTVHHMDLFRIDSEDEALDLGLEEYLDSDGVCVVEWADKAPDALPEEALRLHFDYGAGEQERTVCLSASGGRYNSLLKGLNL